MAVPDDSEWEYEYDENETEDFYITLDLTTHVPPSLAHEKKSSKSNKRGSNKSLANAPGSAQQDTQASPAPAQDEATSPPPPALAADRMQIIDLHRENPLISFNNLLYSCHWATDVGTSLYFTPPPAEADPEHPPLRTTPSFDLLATAFARLIAVPATIKPRHSAPSTVARQPFPGDQSFSTAEGDLIRTTEADGIKIETPSTASAARVSQARFLERLSAIKARRGDQDAVPVHYIKYYKPPEGWEKERDEWIAKETALSDRNRLEAEIRANKHLARGVRFLPIQEHPGGESAEPDTPNQAELGADGEDDSEQDLDTLDPTRSALASQLLQKRKTRGGPRGGAPSSKRLRQSLGLPEARRDQRRAVGRPRNLRLDPEFEEGYQAGIAGSASSHQGSVEPSREHTRDDTENMVEDEQ